jgi:hypothetical protein
VTFPTFPLHVGDVSKAGSWSRVDGNELLVRRCLYRHSDAGLIALHATPSIAPGSTWADLRRAARRDAGDGEVVFVLDSEPTWHPVRFVQRHIERRLAKIGWYFAARFATSAFGVEYVKAGAATGCRPTSSIRKLSRLMSLWQFGSRGDGDIAGWLYGEHGPRRTHQWVRELSWLQIGAVMASPRSAPVLHEYLVNIGFEVVEATGIVVVGRWRL